MNKILLLLILSILLFCAPAFADFAKGLDAAQRGDYATAMKEWKPLAEQGDSSAQYNLGLMYANGRGVIQDYNAAVKWYRLSAEQGDVYAQTNLGLMYSKGEGVTQDYTRAYMWSNIATLGGNKIAMENRDIYAKSISYLQVEQARTLAEACVSKKYKGY
jgi:TPR repeat protein